MTIPKKMEAHIVARVSRKTLTEFQEKCKSYGKPSDVLREIIDAFLTDRLTIEAPATRKSLFKS